MARSVASPEQRAEAHRLYTEEGWSQNEVSRRTGLHTSTIGRWIKAEGWVTPNPKARSHVPTDNELQEAALRAERAAIAARNRWAIKRADVADEAGQKSLKVLDKLMECVDGGKAADAQKFAVVFGILVDKATLLSGDAAGRTNRGEMPNADSDEPRPTSPVEMAAAGRARALALVRPTVDAASREA